MQTKRQDIPKEYKWDLTAIYKTEEDFLRDFAICEEEIKNFSRHENTMTESAEALLSAVSELVGIGVRLDRLWVYASLHFNVDTSDAAAQSREARVRSLAVMLGEASWFFEPRVLSLGKEGLSRFISECPALCTYERQLSKIMRKRAHTLSDECEKLFASLGDCLHLHGGTRSIFANSDLRFGRTLTEDGKRAELTDATYIPLMMSQKREVRRSAFRTMYKTMGQFGATFARMYYNHVKEAATLARVRGYESSLAASTFRDEVGTDIYDNLIRSVRECLPSLFKYYDLKKRSLGLSRMHIYDIYAPMVGEVDMAYTYDEARREVAELGEIFGDEYARVLREGLYERGWVDVYPSRGKRSGAFSSGSYTTEPYILMNFNGSFDDVSTLAHEAGHSMHSYFSRKNNPPEDADYTLFVAEVASTVNELLLMRKRIRESEVREEKLYLLNQLMELYKSTLFRQAMLAEFEREAHRRAEAGEPLTEEVLSGLYYGIVRDYFGTGVVCDAEIAREWMRIPHFYTSFYVYKYATCISAASVIVERIENEGSGYVGRYIEFLSCGDRLSPCDSLRLAGVDMTSPELVRPAVRAFEAAIEEFIKISGGKNE